MKTILSIALGLVALVGLGNVSADSREYVNITGDQFVFCDDGTTGFGQGGVCFEGGHIVPNAQGRGSVSIADDFVSPGSGFWCQDLDNEGSCDDSTEAAFCGAFTFTRGVNWVPSADIFVFGDGPVFGNPVLSVCGSLSVITHGFIGHS